MLPDSIQKLIDEFNKLPSIGSKMASRVVFYLLKQDQDKLDNLANTITELKKSLQLCDICQNYTTEDKCSICQKTDRNLSTVCIVETPLDLIAIEKSGAYTGGYHVLHGVLSPINSIGPEDIKIQELLDRIDSGSIEELIIGLNPNLDSESTAMYILKKINHPDIKITRLGVGLPIGSYLEYADEMTLKRALENRVNY